MSTDNQSVTEAARGVDEIIHRLAEGGAIGAEDREQLSRHIALIRADDQERLGQDEPGAIGSSLLTVAMVADLNALRQPPRFEFGKSTYRDAFYIIEQIAEARHG